MFPSIRPAVTNDAARLRELHDESIRGLCSAEYSADEIDAWAAPKSVEAYVSDIARHVFLVAELAGRVVGFGALAPNHAEVLAVYVAPDCARQGIGSAILRAIEQSARARGIDDLGLKASLTAEGFYRAHGYAAEGRCTHRTSDQELACTIMRKLL